MGQAQAPRTCRGCGATFEIPESWNGRTKDYCKLRCWTKNGPFGSARNGRIEEQHAARELRPA